MLDHELAHISRAEDQGPPSCEIPEDLLGELHGDARHGERAISYPRLGADLLADPERGVEEPVEDLARAVLLGCRPVRLADLAEDLTLPDDHGVERRGDPVEVPHGLSVRQPVRVLLERRPLDAPVFGEQVEHPPLAPSSSTTA